MSNPRTPITHEFKVSGDAEHVEHSVGNVVIDANASIEDILAIRRKQIEDIIKQGGISVKTVITAGSKAKSITTNAYNISFESKPDNATSSVTAEKASNANITENEKNVTAKIPLTGKSDATIIVEKTEGKKNDIKITWYVANFYTGVTIKWDDKQQYKYLEKSGTYHLNATNFDATWKTDQEIAAEQQAALSDISMHNTSTTSTNASASRYSSSSSAVFKAESKPASSKLVSNSVKHPTVKELNDILGKSDLVTAVDESYSYRILISFNSEINPNSYEKILNEKLLCGISNVTLTKTGTCPRLGIPNDAKTYEQFMQNVTSALNKPIVNRP